MTDLAGPAIRRPSPLRDPVYILQIYIPGSPAAPGSDQNPNLRDLAEPCGTYSRTSPANAFPSILRKAKPRVLIGYSCCSLTLEAFERANCEAWTCDLLPSRGRSDRHLQCDVWEAIQQCGGWDMGLFHPMCTNLTCSAAWAFNDPDYDRYPGVGYHQRLEPDTLTGQARRDARDADIRNFERILSLPFPVAAENPAISFLNKAVRRPDQVIQPYEFGDDASKATGLWLERLPPLVKDPAQRIPGRIINGKERWANQTDSGQNRVTPGKDRWLERSKTYPGIAAAFGAQWGALL